jgi:hypothetical protein
MIQFLSALSAVQRSISKDVPVIIHLDKTARFFVFLVSPPLLPAPTSDL